MESKSIDKVASDSEDVIDRSPVQVSILGTEPGKGNPTKAAQKELKKAEKIEEKAKDHAQKMKKFLQRWPKAEKRTVAFLKACETKKVTNANVNMCGCFVTMDFQTPKPKETVQNIAKSNFDGYQYDIYVGKEGASMTLMF